jgi:BirA family biotin operon repressor/biotin-[acetyl-CoA-carboxylase] ligase
MLNETSIRAALRNLPLGGLRVFQTIGSTNDEAKAWAGAGAPDLSLVVADEQTAGRGRGHRKWYTRPGTALALSLILRPSLVSPLPPERLAGLGALAISDACATLRVPSQIKWPNDVLIGRKKVAGVLAETEWDGNLPRATILGLGVNVLEGSIPAQDALAYPATSLATELGRAPDRYELLGMLLTSLLQWRKRVAGPGFIEAWESRLAFRGQEVLLTRDGQPSLAGKLLGLESDGSLRLEVDHAVLVLPTGEIHLRPGNDRIG